jgi:hypothetical protein
VVHVQVLSILQSISEKHGNNYQGMKLCPANGKKVGQISGMAGEKTIHGRQ